MAAEVLSRQVLELVGDDSKLDKTLAGSEKKVAGWGKRVNDEGQKAATGFGSAFERSLFGAGKQLDTTEKKLGAIWSTLKTGAGLIGVTFGAAAIVAFTGKVFDAAGAIKDQASAIGFSTEAFQRNKFAVEQGGGSLEGFTKAAAKLNDNLAEGSDSTIAALKTAGLEFEKIRAMKPEDAWAAVADAVGKIEDPMLRTKVAQDLLGKGAQELLPGMIEGYKKARDAASFMSDDTINRLGAAGDAWQALGDKVIIVTGEMIGGAMKDASAALSGWSKLWGDIKATATGGIEGHRQYIATLQKQATEEAAAKKATEERTAATAAATRGTKQQEEADRKAAQAAEQNRKQIQGIADAWTGAKVQDRVRDVAAAYSTLTPKQRENADVNKKLVAELNKLVAEGGKLPPVLQNIWRAAAIADVQGLKPLTVSVKLATDGLKAMVASAPPPVLYEELFRRGAVAARSQMAPELQRIITLNQVFDRDTRLLSKAWETLGIDSKKSLADQAAAARQAYADILRYGNATADDLKRARQAVFDAEVAAGERTISLWQSQIGPAIKSVGVGVRDHFVSTLGQMLTRQVEVKEGLVAIWHSFRDALFNIFNQLLNAFVTNMLGGMLNAILGQKNAFGAAFSSIFGTAAESAGPMGKAAGIAWAGAASTAIQAFGWAALGVWAGKKLWDWFTKGFGSGDPYTAPDPPSGGGPDPNNPNNPYVDPETGEPYDPGNDFEEGQNSPRLRQYGKGTYRLDFERFRPGGEKVVAHNWEAMIPRGKGHLLAAEIAAALPQGGGTARQTVYSPTFNFPNALLVDRDSLYRFAEIYKPVEMDYLRDMGLAT